MNTDDVMAVALELAGMEAVPVDSGVLYPGEDLQRVMAGIDIGTAELRMAQDLGYDLALAHHPAGGRAVLDFPHVLEKHATLMKTHEVPEEAAREAVEALKAEHVAAAHARNYDLVPSVARMLQMPFMSVHNPCDELGRQILDRTLRDGCDEDATVADAVACLERLPEFQIAETAIWVAMGTEDAPLGRFAMIHGAGTNGGYPVASALYEAGVDTVLYIHVLPAHLARLKERYPEGKNLVITGHLASDSVGMNPLVARLRGEGLEVDCMGGLLDVAQD